MSLLKAKAKRSQSSNLNIADIAYELAADGMESEIMKFIFDGRFECDIEINILRLRDRQTGMEKFREASLKHCSPEGVGIH